MSTNRFTTAGSSATHADLAGLPRLSAGQTVMVVNGRESAMRLLESVLVAGRYDVVFVESTAHAYSHIKRVQPGLVILCTDLRDTDGFQVLSMLRLDDATRGIPVLTCTTDDDDDAADNALDEDEDADGVPFPALVPHRLMN